MKNFQFEIVRSSYGRFSWLLVGRRRGQLRVVARSERDYRSRDRVLRAVEGLKEAVPGAPVFDTTRPFPLPESNFRIDQHVLPLVAGPAVVDWRSARTAAPTRSAPAAGRRAVLAGPAEAERHEAGRERPERRRAEFDRSGRVRVEAERAEAERAEAERAEAERAEAERVEAERAEAERVEAERDEADRREAEQAEAGQAEAGQAGPEQPEAEHAGAEHVPSRPRRRSGSPRSTNRS